MVTLTRNECLKQLPLLCLYASTFLAFFSRVQQSKDIRENGGPCTVKEFLKHFTFYRDHVENYLNYNKHSSSQFSSSFLSESRSLFDSSQMYSRLLSILVMNKIINGLFVNRNK